jgi:signal-transduction protein with cAMP-binding, CBS, and nucleotidyltransferase domain
MNSPVISARPNDTLKKVASLMVRYKVGSMVIMEKDSPIGMVTDGDIALKAVAKSSNPSHMKAKEVMSQPLQTIEGSKDVTEAARLMRKLNIKRLGVSYKGQLVGVISISDINAVTPELFDIVSEKTRIMTGESRRRKGYLAGYCDICNQWSDYLTESDGKFTCEECTAERPKD